MPGSRPSRSSVSRCTSPFAACSGAAPRDPWVSETGGGDGGHGTRKHGDTETRSSFIFVVLRDLVGKPREMCQPRLTVPPTASRPSGQDTKLFETILGIQMPWRISRVALDTTGERDVRKQAHRGFLRAGTKYLWLFSEAQSRR